ncbi:MAG: GTP 3',8-cyclase MoaA, partial [Armatimonadota bacterium]
MRTLPLAQPQPEVEDRFGRRIRYLRVSLTDRCNLRCVYCMPEGGMDWEDPASLLTFEEIERCVRVLASAGLRKVRLTGGEPLVRKGVPEFAGRLAAIPGLEEVTLTTNAILLEGQADALKSSGIRRINISLDSLRPERFARIARRDDHARAWAGIEAALRIGFDPVKINCVVMRGENDDEVVDFARLAFERGLEVRFLEYMPIGMVSPAAWRAKYVSNEEVLAMLRTQWPNLAQVDTAASSTSRLFRLPGISGTVGVINPISHRFCDGCDRLRLTADGKLVPCLSDNLEHDLRGPMRAGIDDRELLDHVR